VVLAIVVGSLVGLRENAGGHIPFLTAFVHLFVMFSFFKLVDLLLLDWPIVAVGPKFIVLPGTEGLAGYKDYGFYLRGSSLARWSSWWEVS
jgi:hypothetical protein